MPVSIYDASDFPHKCVGYVYELCLNEKNTVFYVGKTYDPKNRLTTHISEAKSTRRGFSEKSKLIKSLLDSGIKPIMNIIESHNIRTGYDKLYYDYREFYFIRSYIEKGIELTNVRINDIIQSEKQYKRIISDAKSGAGLLPSDFYYGNDKKGFAVYDLKKMKELGYSFSKNQYASHWAYIIDIEKYADIEETKLAYVYSDIHDEHSYNPNWADGLW